MPASVYLVRHGQSEWNELRLTQGQTPHPRLTAQGREQAEAAAALIATDLTRRDQTVASIVSSDLARARETAEVIADALGVEVVVDARLREQHLGELEGKSYDETWAAAALHDWTDPSRPIAGGESLLAVRERMVAALHDLAPDRVHVVVSHGDAIRAAVAHARGEAPQLASWIDVPNGAVARVGPTIEWLSRCS